VRYTVRKRKVQRDMYDFGARLRELREKKGLSQAQVATRLNLSNTTICSYEANTRYPSFETLSQLALFYNTTSDYILGIENRNMICVDGLSKNQLDIINAMITELQSHK
jgi:transcriptional regulator with XRE-family HTH domain